MQCCISFCCTTVWIPCDSVSAESAWNVGDLGLIPGLERSPGGGHGNPHQYSGLENPHGQRSLVGYSPWGCKELDVTAQLSTCMCTHTHTRTYQFSSFAQLCLTLCDPMDCSMPGFPVHHQLLEPTETHVHNVSDAIQPSHPQSSPSPPALNLSQHQGLFQWVGSSHQVAKELEFQLQHQSFQWTFRTDFL